MIAAQPVRSAPIVLIAGVFAPAGDQVVPAGDQLDPLVMIVCGLLLLVVGLGIWQSLARFGLKKTLEAAARVILGVPLTLIVLRLVHRLTGFPPAVLLYPLWIVLILVVLKLRGGWVPGPVRLLWASLFAAVVRDTHGTAHFGTARDAVRHLAPAAPEDGFVLGFAG